MSDKQTGTHMQTRSKTKPIVMSIPQVQPQPMSDSVTSENEKLSQIEDACPVAEQSILIGSKSKELIKEDDEEEKDGIKEDDEEEKKDENIPQTSVMNVTADDAMTAFEAKIESIRQQAGKSIAFAKTVGNLNDMTESKKKKLENGVSNLLFISEMKYEK